MDKKEVLVFETVTEDDMICRDCVWRGSQEGMPAGRCMMYEVKPFPVMGRAKNAECPAYLNENDITVFRKGSE